MKVLKYTMSAIVAAAVVCSTTTAVLARDNDYDVVRDRNGQVVRSSFGDCVRTQWTGNDSACSGARAAKSGSRVTDAERTIYFEFNKATLTPGARKKLDGLATILKSQRKDVRGVSIVGYADRIGDTEKNQRLSEQRARAVEKYLHQHGYLDTRVVKTRWVGESEPVTKCSDHLGRAALITCLQKDRRVEVELNYIVQTGGAAAAGRHR